jgi:hypothetical protein
MSIDPVSQYFILFIQSDNLEQSFRDATIKSRRRCARVDSRAKMATMTNRTLRM